MIERKQPTKYVPLRVRFRSPTESAQTERGSTSSSTDPGPRDTEPLVPDLADTAEPQRRTQQIKELLRLSNFLRGELGLHEMLRQIAASIAACIGFRSLVIHLIKEQCITSVAFVGIAEERQHALQQAKEPVDILYNAMRAEFRISQSYLVPHTRSDVLGGTTFATSIEHSQGSQTRWHTGDFLIIPLYSLRNRDLLGFISANDLEDDVTATEESIEIAELFANQAAIAIDNAYLIQEREEEQQALEQGITTLCEDLEQLQQGNLQTRVHTTHPQLQPAIEAINTTIEEFNTIVKGIHTVTSTVDEHARIVQHDTDFLVRDTSQQERQVQQISRAIEDSANKMHDTSERAAYLSKTFLHAVEVTNEAKEAVNRALEGMNNVRETTMQSARIMKSLGESGQGINEAIVSMTDLTTRMHVLALNAAIEAARAGDYGKGFRAIAQEMRSLATHSAEAARKVDTYIRTFQHETMVVSHSIEQEIQQVVVQTDLVTQTRIALEAICTVTEQVNNLIEGICTTTESQESGSQLVVSAVGEILHMTEDITMRMRETQKSMTHLIKLTDSLRSRLAILQTDKP